METSVLAIEEATVALLLNKHLWFRCSNDFHVCDCFYMRDYWQMFYVWDLTACQTVLGGNSSHSSEKNQF